MTRTKMAFNLLKSVRFYFENLTPLCHMMYILQNNLKKRYEN